MPPIFEQTILVDESAIDRNGHANNVAYVQWMQDVAVAHARAAGYDGAALDALGSTWVVRSHTIRYRRPALLGDALIAQTWVSEVKRASSLRRYRFVRASDGATIITGETDWVYVDRATSRPRPIDAEVRAAFALLPPAEEPK